DAWRRGRISPRVDVPRSDFYDDSGGCFVHLGDYPLEVDEQYIAQFSAEGEATIFNVKSAPVRGKPEDWDGGIYMAPDGMSCLVDMGRGLVLSSPIKTRLGRLWISADEVARLIEQPAEEVWADALREASAPESAAPPKGKVLDAQIDALVQVIEGMGYDPQNIPDCSKRRILDGCLAQHPELFPPRTGALTAWKQASKRKIIRHNQK
ncbi:MAG TPA: hypothetical protein VMV54_06290, partial [Acidocella sp.]|nr:hypothetical protein [Acidocella sp.]